MAMSACDVTMDVEDDSDSKQPRFLMVVRHAHRMDYEYGEDWTSRITERPDGRYNLALPFTDPVEYDVIDVPTRTGGLASFTGDTPLTPTGHQTAMELGEYLKQCNLSVSHVYSSPALRCVQTAAGLIKGLDQHNLTIHVEPGLFELLSLRPIPTFMTLSELKSSGLTVDMTYRPLWPQSRYNPRENRKGLYERTEQVTQAVVDRHEGEGGNILIVGHAASLDTCVRKLLGKRGPSNRDFYEALNADYCEMKVVKEKLKLENGKRVWGEARFPAR